MPPSKTSRIQLVCPSCSATFWTRVRGRSTKCPHCKAGRYVRQDAEWEGPVTAQTQRDYDQAARVANRLPVWCSCSNCGEAWQSRAKDQQRVRCPSCQNGIRVPYRTHANTGPTPQRYRPSPPAVPSPPPRPARVRPASVTELDDEPDHEPEQDGPTVAQAMSAFMATFRRPATAVPTPARPARPASRPARPAPRKRPAPSPVPAVPRPLAQPAAPLSPYEVERERTRRERVGTLGRFLGGPLYLWADQPPGACEVLDSTQPREHQRCPHRATVAVQLRNAATEATAYACPQHALSLTALANRSAYVTATTHQTRRPPFQPYRPCEACAEENTRTATGTYPPAAHRITIHENGTHKATADFCNGHAAAVHALPIQNPHITVTDIR